MSPEELVRNTSNARENPRLLYLAELDDSPSTTEMFAEDREYPLSLVREVRLLTVLRRDHPEIFTKITDGKKRSRDENMQRVFPCHLRRKGDDEFTMAGELHVTIHPFLPPLFWDYKIYAEDVCLVFSCDPAVKLSRRSEEKFEDGVVCMLSAGSKSLPVGLVFRAGQSYGYASGGKEMVFERKFDYYNLNWSRTIPNPELSRGYENINSFERETCWQDDRSRDRVTLRNLTQFEKELWKYKVFGSNPFLLFLESSFKYPFGEDSGKILRITLKTIYHFHDLDKERPFLKHGCPKFEEIVFPPENSWFTLSRNHKVLTSVMLMEGNAGQLTPPEETIEQNIQRVICSTPSYIKGLEALWKLFSFKETEPDIYDEMLPPWEQRKK